MKNMKHIICISIILMLGMYGCSKVDSLIPIGNEEIFYGDITKGVSDGEDSYIIEEKDIYNYIEFLKMTDKEFMKDNKLKQITPIKWTDAICLYALEYDRGYEIISADKRSQVPLVHDNIGKFEFPTDESPLGFHIYTLAEDVWFSLYRNDLLEKPDKETKDNIDASLLFWNLVNADFKTIQSNSVQIKSVSDTIILNPEEGYWKQVDVSIRELEYDISEHLIPTWWHQNIPFNSYCPQYSQTHTARCPAGCVVIAAAQVLNYLHYKLGVPQKSPTYAYCSGYVADSTYTQSFGLFHSSTWDQMMPTTDPSGYAAMLIGYVGKILRVRYNINGSKAYAPTLKDRVFLPYGINCTTFNYYSGSFLKGNLSNGIPVICSGTRELPNSDKISGHAFIVDRYKRSREEITFTYEWVFENPESAPGYNVTKTSIVYNTPYITHYQMNWGYGYAMNFNDAWCSMNGTWQYGGCTPYINNRKMVCNFSVL